MYERKHGDPRHRFQWHNTFTRLFEEASARLPHGVSREELYDAILERTVALKLKRKKEATPKLPPKA